MSVHRARAMDFLAQAQDAHREGNVNRATLALMAAQVHASLSIQQSLTDIENTLRRMDQS